MIKLAPSILAADPLNLEREVLRVEQSGCDWLHIDVMDAHFVPNLAYGPDVVRSLKRVTRLPLDVHLMMDHPERLLETFLDAGADGVTIHAEIDHPVSPLLRRIRERGVRAGLALKPATPMDTVVPLLHETDLILCMTVEPGFGGQKLDTQVLDKIQMLHHTGYHGEIQADGGIREDNLASLINRGLTVAVMGTALFHSDDLPALVSRLHALKEISQ